jgi:hypothetical protein
VLLTASLTLLVLAILGGGQAWEWDSAASIGAFIVGGLLLAGFCIAARRAVDPILPAWVLTRRLLLTTTAIQNGAAAVFAGVLAVAVVAAAAVVAMPSTPPQGQPDNS